MDAMGLLKNMISSFSRQQVPGEVSWICYLNISSGWDPEGLMEDIQDSSWDTWMSQEVSKGLVNGL